MDDKQVVDLFIEEQIQSASGRRLENLQKELIGEKKMLNEVIWPVFQSMDGFTLEYEVKTIKPPNPLGHIDPHQIQYD